MRVGWSKTKKASAIVATVVCGALALGAAPVQAASHSSKKPIGPVQGLQVSVSKPGASYRVDSTWTALSAADSYRVTMTDATGSVVDQDVVTQNSWHGSTSLRALSRLTLKVVPFTATNKRGKAATKGFTLPDLTAPTASFRVEDALWEGTVTQLSLTDDVTAAADVVREINWGAGFEPWTTGDSVTSTFSTVGIYPLEVRLTDGAGNSRTYNLTLVIGDETTPEGQFAVSPATGWAKLTRVTVSQLALSDDFSAAGDIERWVIWRAGAAPVLWQSGTTVSHVYRVAGTFVPVVRLVDQAGNSVKLPTSTVVTKADTVAPVVSVKVPKRRVRYVDTWRTVHGKATDANGVGVAKVRFRAVQKRGSVWYAYRAPSRHWVKAGSTKSGALKKSRYAAVTPTARHTWSYRVSGLRKGKLVLAVNGRDRVGNLSRRVYVSQKLTR